MARLALLDDPEVDGLQEDLRSWVRSYLKGRIEKWNPKDQGLLYRRFLRIQKELVLEFTRLAFPGPSVHPFCLGHLSRYMTWELHRRTVEEWQKEKSERARNPGGDDYFVPLLERTLLSGLV